MSKKAKVIVKKSNLPAKSIEALFGSVRHVIDQARGNAYRSVNTIMVKAYWEIGRMIFEEEQHGKERAEYGTFIIAQLSRKLSFEYGKGFDESNLRYMRLFYKGFSIRDALRHELSWTHYRLLLRVENESARIFYMQEAVECNWSTRTLDRQVNSLYYERMLMTRKKKDKISVKAEAEEKKVPMEAKDIVKDPYVLDFLNLKDSKKFREEQLESGLIEKLQEFMLELGKGFSFVGRQYRVSTEEGNHFYVDLV
jgi:predicted nuclease of restriction endonuclease-like (RecB) superfamily